MRQQRLPIALLIFCFFFSLAGEAQCDASFNSSSTTVCSGNVVNFINTSSGNTTNTWKINETPFSTAVNSSFPFPTVGSFMAELVVSDGMGCVDSASTMITVNQTPVVNVNVITTTLWASDSTYVNFSASGVLPGATYYWDFCDGNFWPNSTPFYYQWSAPGTTYCVCVQLENTNGCADNDCELNIVVNDDLGLNESNGEKVLLYPNPSSGEVTLQLGEDNEFNLVTLSDNTGRKIRTYETLGESSLIIEKGELSAGVYFVKITSTEYEVVRQLVIE